MDCGFVWKDIKRMEYHVLGKSKQCVGDFLDEVFPHIVFNVCLLSHSPMIWTVMILIDTEIRFPIRAQNFS